MAHHWAYIYIPYRYTAEELQGVYVAYIYTYVHYTLQHVVLCVVRSEDYLLGIII